MEQSHPAVDIAARGGCTQPPNAARSVVERHSFNGTGMADSGESTPNRSSNDAASTEDLAGGCATNDLISERSREATGGSRVMGVLGKREITVSQSVHQEVKTPKLRPSEMTRLLNSTPLGRVISERQLYRHRQKAGNRVSAGRRVDFVRYVAWLIHERHERIGRCGRRYASESGKDGMKANQVLALLKKQSYRCALTGEYLRPENAALDHVTPVSRGGEHCITNAQVLTKQVNKAKGTLTNEEFIQLCREVVAHVNQQMQPRRYSA